MASLFEAALQHVQNGDFESGLSCYQQILLTEPDQFEAGLNTGVALLNLGRFHDALPYLQTAMARSPSILTCGNLAICLFRLTHFAEAEILFRRVLAVDPENAAMQFNLAFDLLAQGKYREGWRLYGSRKHAADYAQREPFPGVPRWTGQSLDDGRSLAVYHEQGFGDALLLSRYLISAQDRAANISIICPATLSRLFTRSFGLPTISDPRVVDVPDYQCSLFDLPEIFEASTENISRAPYLVADPVLMTAWRKHIATTLPIGYNVGLVWSGNQYKDAAHVALRDSRRSLSLMQLAPLFEVSSHINFISLQKGEASEQARNSGLPLHDWTYRLDDFADTAALISILDLVISVDTSVVHLAAGMGKPVWVLNRYDSVYPWLPNRQIPWYDTVREFRQPCWGDWTTAIQRLCVDLAK